MRRRMGPGLGTVLFFFGPPVLTVVVVPGAITHWWEVGSPFLGRQALRWLGVACMVAAGPVVGESMVRFVQRGHGTPAPWAPPQRFVAGGFYRFVRNPMYIGVIVLLVGEGLLFASVAVLVWAAVVAVSCHLFVFFYEERTLRRRFGDEYEAYRGHVGRWCPRLRPWTPP